MFRCCCVLICWMTCRSRPPARLVTVLPLNAAGVFTSSPLSLRAMSTTFATYVVGANETSLWRSTVLVVLPHSRSIVPFASSGRRVADVTGR
ncbi:hypothetical protein LMG27174_07343 [Paraburkholderia rhynchosiae]|uniref:Secreted protein n=1 Tax=Paraburkholderia rhynchosiae TaxID=487049 RepID=A0A6J5CUL3_9BURK|nr:hypothetical protein LMG27174_07343 [Paraburkholderia rhynchosiae]